MKRLINQLFTNLQKMKLSKVNMNKLTRKRQKSGVVDLHSGPEMGKSGQK